MKKRGIDKLFKEELEHLEGDFQVEHWEAMQNLLDQRDESRRKPFFVWFMVGAIAVLGVTTYALWGSDSVMNTEQNIELVKVSKNAETAVSPSVMFKKVEPKKELDLIEQRDQEDQKNIIEDKINRIELIRTIQDKNEISIVNSNLNIQNKIEKNGLKQIMDGEPSHRSGMLKSEDTAVQSTDDVNESNNVTQQSSSVMSERSKVSEIVELKELMLIQRQNYSLVTAKNLVLPELNIVNHDIEPIQNTKTYYRSGLSGYFSSEWYPYSGQNVQFFRGYSAGLAYSQVVNGNYKLNVGLGLRQMSGTFGATDESIQTVFTGFGWTRDFHSYKPSEVFYLDMPIYMGYFKGRHSLLFGTRIQKLLAIRAEHIVEGYDQNQLVNTTQDDATPVYTRSNETWVRSSAFNDIRAELALSYGFALFPGWTLQAEGRYGIKGVLIEADDRDLLREYRPLSASVRLTIGL